MKSEKQYIRMFIWDFIPNVRVISQEEESKLNESIKKYLFLFGISYKAFHDEFTLDFNNPNHVKKGLKNIKIILEKNLTSKQKII